MVPMLQMKKVRPEGAHKIAQVVGQCAGELGWELGLCSSRAPTLKTASLQHPAAHRFSGALGSFPLNKEE